MKVSESKTEKQQEFECPLCHSKMKWNPDFQIAKCSNCGLVLNLSSPVQRLMSMGRIVEEIGVRKYGWRRTGLF